MELRDWIVSRHRFQKMWISVPMESIYISEMKGWSGTLCLRNNCECPGVSYQDPTSLKRPVNGWPLIFPIQADGAWEDMQTKTGRKTQIQLGKGAGFCHLQNSRCYTWRVITSEDASTKCKVNKNYEGVILIKLHNVYVNNNVFFFALSMEYRGYILWNVISGTRLQHMESEGYWTLLGVLWCWSTPKAEGVFSVVSWNRR